MFAVIYSCVCLCINAKHLKAAQCSFTEDDVLILKQFTVAPSIGCGINSSHSDIQVRGGEVGERRWVPDHCYTFS